MWLYLSVFLYRIQLLFHIPINKSFAHLLTHLLIYLTSGLLGDAEDIEQRIEKFGVNVIPQKPPPSFLQLAWEALQDPLLVILGVAAFITIGLSFYQAPPDDKAGTRPCAVFCGIQLRH